MPEHHNQRGAERFLCESPIVCSSLNGKSVYPARTINHCASGLGFITQTPLKSGMMIFFRADTHTRKRIDSGSCRTMRGAGLAQVRWCHRLRDQETTYSVGAAYVEPYP